MVGRGWRHLESSLKGLYVIQTQDRNVLREGARCALPIHVRAHMQISAHVHSVAWKDYFLQGSIGLAKWRLLVKKDGTLAPEVGAFN